MTPPPDDIAPVALDPSRRAFLKRGISVLGGMIAAGLALPGGIYFLSPLWQRAEEDWIEVAEIAGIPLGQPQLIEFIQRRKDGWMTIEGRASAWVITTDGQQFTVFDPRCTHLGCPYRWDAEKQQFLCPCHNAIFSVDGAVLAGPPPRGLDRLPVKVAGGKLLLQPRPRREEG